MKYVKRQPLTKRSRWILLFLPGTFAFFTQAAAQQAGPGLPEVHAGIEKELEGDLEQYRSQHLQEKIFVHTDKDTYLAGEIGWFKLYDVDATLHRPLDLSKVAYLEWLDKNNKPVLQAKIGLKGGLGGGSVYFPLTMRSGNYRLRAYTSWMKNYSADWFFSKTITVINSRKSAEVPLKTAPLQYAVQFFPEGGNMVENISSNIAFRATDQYGRGIACTGVVTEDDQDTVARFLPLRFGIGHFTLTPRAGHRYRSTVRLADGTAISTLLPAAYREGMVMRLTREGERQIRVTVESSFSGGAGSGGGSMTFLVAHTRQSVRITEASVLKDGKTSFLLDKNLLGDGISQLTLFNAARQPVCERLIFKNPAHRLQLAILADQDSYMTRKKINLRVSAAGWDNRPVGADCSLAVYRVDSMQTIPSDHIDDYLWLRSDLKGNIESPDYYFGHPEDEEAMDNLMMTHGWRRFRWEEVEQHSAPYFEFPPEYNGTIISGRMVNTRTGAAAREIQGYVSLPGTRTQFSSSVSNEEGNLKFELKDFYGSQELVVQTNPNVDSLYRVDILSPFSDSYPEAVMTPYIPPLNYPVSLTDKSVAMQVLNRYGGEKLKHFVFPAADTTVFYLKPDNSYLLDDYTRFTTMEEVMREYVTLMLVKRSGIHYHLPLLDFPNNVFFEEDPLILLDGIPVFDIDKLMAMDPLKIRKLDVIHRKYFLGGTSFDGVMNWVTYKGDLGGYILDPHTAVLDYEGLQLKREFYSPSYETQDEAGSHLPDFRNVLYWSPDLKTDSLGRAAQSFFSSDIPGHYVVVLEGLTPDGCAGSGMMHFEVK